MAFSEKGPTAMLRVETEVVAEPHVVRLKTSPRVMVDAPEPGTYRDEFTGRLRRQRRKSEWWGSLLDRHRRDG